MDSLERNTYVIRGVNDPSWNKIEKLVGVYIISSPFIGFTLLFINKNVWDNWIVLYVGNVHAYLFFICVFLGIAYMVLQMLGALIEWIKSDSDG